MPHLGLPWLLLANPAAGWAAVRSDGTPLWPAFATQLALLLLGWVAAAKPLRDLAAASEIDSGSLGVGSALALAAFVISVTAAFALVSWGLLKATGSPAAFRDVMAWLAFGLTPIYIGRFLGLLSFAVFQPLASNPAEAIALQVNPLGLSLASFFTSLSLPWLMAAALDVFALWALVLLAQGAARYLRLGTARTAAALGTLLLIWLLALTVAWQGLQRSL